MSLSAATITDLTQLVGVAHARSHADLQTRDPGVDSHNLGADLWLRPGDCETLAGVLRYCHDHHIPVVPHGGRTGLSGGAQSQAGDVIVSLERFDTLEIDPISRTAVVGAGVTLATLAAAAACHGLSVGIDFGARESASIGGMVSTNAGGISAFRHGTVRERVLGLEAVLPDGRLLSELGQVVKRNEGLAIERLLIGAEGTLGIVTRVALALVAVDGSVGTALVSVPGLEQAAALTARALALHDVQATALEVMSGNHAAAVCQALQFEDLKPLTAAPFLMLIELAASTLADAETALLHLLEGASEDALAVDAVIAQNESQRTIFWRVREDWAVDRARPGGLWYDVSVPLSRVAGYVQTIRARLTRHDPALELYLLGHLADGNLHVTVNASVPITARYDEIALLVTEGLTELGGSYSAEHGIGREKKSTLERWMHPTKRRLMQDIKALIDPHRIMNPGKVIPR